LTEDEDFYILSNGTYYYPVINKRSDCGSCGSIQKTQLILINDNPDEMKRFLVNKI
jgi:hypothetical protein